jgi:hypothetical protein
MKPKEDTSKWYLVDSFKNEVVDTDNNIIAVGSTSTNALQQLWTRPDAFVYDKLLEKTTPTYPGPGRGVIGSLDAINYATYDLESQARDAIIIGGSDDPGTTNAVQKFLQLLTQYAR